MQKKVKNNAIIFYLIFVFIIIAILTFMQALIGPLLIAFILSYILNPLLSYFEKHHINRSYAAILVVILFSCSILLASWILVPIVYNQIISIIKHFSAFKIYVEDILVPNIQNFISNNTGQKFNKSINIYEYIPTININKYLETIIAQLGNSTKFIASWLLLIIITPILLFFFLRDLRKLNLFIISMVPIALRPNFLDIMFDINQKLKAVIFGQLLVISILCVLYSTFLYIAGLPSAIAVGILIGLARFIPYLDTLTGIFLCFFVLITNIASNQLFLTVYIAFFAVQFLDGLVITPRIMGKFSDLPPALVLLAIICFGSWFGFYGILLAVPTAAIIKSLAKNMLNKYTKSNYFINK